MGLDQSRLAESGYQRRSEAEGGWGWLLNAPAVTEGGGSAGDEGVSGGARTRGNDGEGGGRSRNMDQDKGEKLLLYMKQHAVSAYAKYIKAYEELAQIRKEVTENKVVLRDMKRYSEMEPARRATFMKTPKFVELEARHADASARISEALAQMNYMMSRIGLYNQVMERTRMAQNTKVEMELLQEYVRSGDVRLGNESQLEAIAESMQNVMDKLNTTLSSTSYLQTLVADATDTIKAEVDESTVVHPSAALDHTEAFMQFCMTGPVGGQDDSGCEAGASSRDFPQPSPDIVAAVAARQGPALDAAS